MNQELADAGVYAPARRCMCTAVFLLREMMLWLPSWTDVVKYRTSSINVYLLGEQSCRISSRSNLKRRGDTYVVYKKVTIPKTCAA